MLKSSILFSLTVITKRVITTVHALRAPQSRSSISIACVLSQIYPLLHFLCLIWWIAIGITLEFKQNADWSRLVHPRFGALPLKNKQVWRAVKVILFSEDGKYDTTMLPRWCLKKTGATAICVPQGNLTFGENTPFWAVDCCMIFPADLKQFEITDFLLQRLNQSM